MKRSTKAALLSGLIFPGVGHLMLKQYLRASLLIVVALGAMSYIVDAAFGRALVVVDRIYSADIPVDAAALTDMVAESASGGEGLLENAALLLLMACWLFGIVDSYRLGAATENEVTPG